MVMVVTKWIVGKKKMLCFICVDVVVAAVVFIRIINHHQIFF